jgi:polyisoprenoid-binding protein YceI
MSEEKPKTDARAYLTLFPPPGEYTFDPVHSFVEFSVQHVVVGQVWGRFNSISGKIRIADDPSLSTFEGGVDAASVDTHSSQRDADLRSERYFEVEKYPRMAFSSTQVKFEPGGHLTVEGNLTIRDLTRQVSWTLDFWGVVKDQKGIPRSAFQAKTEFNRKDFGLLTDLEKESGGLTMGNDVHVQLAVEAVLMK